MTPEQVNLSNAIGFLMITLCQLTKAHGMQIRTIYNATTNEWEHQLKEITNDTTNH